MSGTRSHDNNEDDGMPNAGCASGYGALASHLPDSAEAIPIFSDGTRQISHEKISRSRIQTQGLIETLTGLLELGQQIMTAQGEADVTRVEQRLEI